MNTWAPLLVRERDATEPIAATYAAEGTDVDFGSVTRQLFEDFTQRGGNISRGTEVIDLHRETNGLWEVDTRDRNSGAVSTLHARTVLIGAGGWTLKLLRSAHAPEVRGYGLLPVSGTFLSTTASEIVEQHPVKVYGKAPTGAPPMSMPHLDARVIDGKPSVLFGPFAGAVPKYLKNGSMLDLPKSLRPDNLWSLATMSVKNLSLVSLLVRDLMTSHAGKVEALRAFAPSVRDTDWHTTVAGQRAQIVKPNAKGRGVLQFGTEVISSAEGTLAGVLGASPGASTAVPIALDILGRSFPSKIDTWTSGLLRDYIPSLGTALATDAKRSEEVKASITATLKLNQPNSGYQG
ncbi:FAD-dependent oxidoreductase [Corynebacterium sputi]|uniref:FAD-dependent oxidoreductase n=1 Tax=Corynebacterium sputi TaxID=489915 RepID=UPI0023E3ADF2|nr:FAD-dependent oxidoreductase [Corynebacterium sputi]